MAKDLTFRWQTPVGAKSGAEVQLTGLPAGSHEVACTVSDPDGGMDTAYFTVSVADAQGYRLPENPKTFSLVCTSRNGKCSVNQAVRGDKTPNFRNPEYKKYFGYKRSGTMPEFSLNDIHGGKAYVGFTYAGYLDVPADGDYEVRLDGHNYIWLQVGNDPIIVAKGIGGPQLGVITDKKSGPKALHTLPRVKLRQGLHRIKASVTMTRHHEIRPSTSLGCV